MAGITDRATAGVGARAIALIFVGWSMQHYYLDSKIWRVSRDQALKESLDIP